jgi:uncharacterized protein
MPHVERVRLPVDDPHVDAVTAAVHLPQRAGGHGVLLAPGAGGDLDGDGLVALAALLAELGHPTVRVNLPYREAGRRAAPRADRSVEPYRRVLAAAQAHVDAPGPWVLGGKSYGGRVASLAVAQGQPAAGLVFYGYPLHPPGKPERLRVDHWPHVTAPCLFLQGDRDPFCQLGLLDVHLRKLPRRSTLHVVAGGDHSLRVTAKASPTGTAAGPPATIAGLREVVRGWLLSLDD